MKAKKYAYAAIGAPVSLAKQTQDRIDDIRAKATEGAMTLSKNARNQVTIWSKEGEKFVGTVTDSKRIDDLTSKVDLDQAKEQVNKLRDQLEDLLATWKTNFRPESKTVTKEKVVVETGATAAAKTSVAKPAAKTTAAKTAAVKTAAQKPAAKKPVTKKPARKPAAKSTATKASAAKKAPARKPAARTTAPKTTTAKAS